MASVMSPARESQAAVSATKLLINNRWVPSESGKTFATINPSTGEEICQISEADAGDVEKAVKAARAAFERGAWRKMPASERGRLLHRLADLIEQNADQLARLDLERDLFKRRSSRTLVIEEGDVLERDRAARFGERPRLRRVGDLVWHIQVLEEALEQRE